VDYRPPRWHRGGLNRWIAARPGRLITWWAVVTFLALAAVARALSDPVPWFAVGFVLLVNVAVDARYTPRTIRAWRRERALGR